MEEGPGLVLVWRVLIVFIGICVTGGGIKVTSGDSFSSMFGLTFMAGACCIMEILSSYWHIVCVSDKIHGVCVCGSISTNYMIFS